MKWQTLKQLYQSRLPNGLEDAESAGDFKCDVFCLFFFFEGSEKIINRYAESQTNAQDTGKVTSM